MSDAAVIAALAALALVFAGVLVELVRTRRAVTALAAAVFVPGKERLGDLVQSTRDLAIRHGDHLAVIERHSGAHLKGSALRNGHRP